MTWLVKAGCGWLGYTPSVVRESHLQDIHEAYEGKLEMLKACYGGGDDDKKNKSKSIKHKNTVEDFDLITGNR